MGKISVSIAQVIWKKETRIFRMSSVFVILFALCHAALAGRPYVEPEYLDKLQLTGHDEEFAPLLGVDVEIVRAPEDRSEGDIIFTKVSHLGDILLTREQEEQARAGINFGRHPSSKWPNNVIPYTIGGGQYTSSQRNIIVNAIANWNNLTRNLKIRPRTSEKDYVVVMSRNGCYSNLGRVGGQQVISLQRNGCLSNGTIQHEFMHAAGFAHEHTRLDRDDHVNVLWDNIPEDWHSQYQKVSSQSFWDVSDYEYKSVMHYPLNAPGTNKPAFEILKGNAEQNELGQRSGLTKTDVEKINVLYS